MMTDQIELRLRSTLRSAALPQAPDSLRDFVYDLPASRTVRPAWRPSPLLIAATLSLLLLALLSAIFVASRPPTPTPLPSPSPVPTVTVAFHDLLTDFRTDEVVLDRSEGQAGEPVSADRTTKTVDLGTIELPGPFVAALMCRGPGPLSIDIWSTGPVAVPTTAQPTTGRLTVAGWQTDCTGAVELQSMPFAHGESAVNVELTVPRGASWRVAIASYPEEVAEPPRDFGSLRQTEGWHVLADYIPPGLATRLSPAESTVNVPAGASKLGVVVWCDGDSDVTVTANLADQRVACPTARNGQRVEFELPSGGTYTVRARPDYAAWVRMLIEADAEFATSYPTGPPLPAAIARAVYASVEGTGFPTDSGRVAIGRVGANTQDMIEIDGVPMEATAKGDYAAVAVTDGDANYWIEVWTTEPLEFVTSVGENTGLIPQAFLDATHGRVYYLSFRDETSDVELRTVAVDGTDDRVLATYPAETWNGTAALADDDFALVVIDCAAAGACQLTVVNPTELTTSQSAIDGSWQGCILIGVAAGAFAAQCYSDSGEETVIGSLDGTVQDTLTEILPAALVATSGGPALVYTEGTTPDGGSWTALDLSSDVETSLFSFGADELDANLFPARVALPEDWLLFATNLGDFPATQMSARPVPRVVNVATGEVILLENLPHD